MLNIKFLKNNSIFDFLVSLFLSHIYYKITFVNSLETDFALIDQIRFGSISSQSFFVESPTFTFISLLLGIESLDIFKILVYLVTVGSLFLIAVNVQHLNEYSTLFMLSGWLISCSWFVGFVDIISVLLMVLISKNIIENKITIRMTFLYFLLLCLNHNAISFGVSLIYLILAKKEFFYKLLSLIVSTQIIGNLLINLYLNKYNFSGRGRFRFVFNDNVIESATNFVGSNLLVILWSGFFGSSIVFILLFNLISWTKTKKILISVLICLFFTSIALDTSRVFSLLIVPIIIYTLDIYKKFTNFDNKLSITYTSTIFLILLIGVYHFFGVTKTSSPNNNIENFYDFIPRIINSIMSNIWK